MSIIIKTSEEIENIKECGKRLALVVDKVIEKIQPGITTGELDEYAEKLIKEKGDEPAFKGYQPEGASTPFPATLCVSINEEIVHGIPGERQLQEGDIVTIDCGIKHKGVFTDHARTVAVGSVSKQAQELMSATKEAMERGIQEALPGNRVGDIGAAIEEYVGKSFGIVRVLAGHGVGRHIHEEPFIPNFGKRGAGELLTPGMVIAIEPMLTKGTEEVLFHSDGYTASTKDKKLSAHFEHTVLITENGPEIVTKLA